jgi:hypothetical protein
VDARSTAVHPVPNQDFARKVPPSREPYAAPLQVTGRKPFAVTGKQGFEGDG